ncbi:DUF1298 domain-containing protein [Rhodococcus fascians]|nr:DUF1298 domain-containing protein [Rhodococcus fascians]
MPRDRPDSTRPESTHLHPADARAYWMASKIPSDQFVLYCFDARPEGVDTGAIDAEVARLLGRSARIGVLRGHITDAPLRVDYPRWTDATPSTDAVTVHPVSRTWAECLDAISNSLADQVDPCVSVWRLHLYPNVTDAPGGSGPTAVAVLQISHAAADGALASTTARDLLGTHSLSPRYLSRSTWTEPAATARAVATLPLRLALMVRGGLRARRDALDLDRATDSGSIPPPARSWSLTPLDVPPTGRTSLRTIVLPKAHVRAEGITVTTFVLTAISIALQNFLDTSADLGAEVTLARPKRGSARNHFGNVGVGLFTSEPDIRTRLLLISEDLAARRVRAHHPLAEAARASQDDVEVHVPAFLAEWGVAQFDPTVTPPTVIGNTVVSSVSRGAADLTLCGGPVRFTAGFPALSPAMSVTHGVHGIGDTVTIGITSNSAAVPEPDHYEALLRTALEQVRVALT